METQLEQVKIGIAAVVRHVLGIAGGYLCGAGILEGFIWQEIAGAVCAVVAIVLSLWDKKAVASEKADAEEVIMILDKALDKKCGENLDLAGIVGSIEASGGEVRDLSTGECQCLEGACGAGTGGTGETGNLGDKSWAVWAGSVFCVCVMVLMSGCGHVVYTDVEGNIIVEKDGWSLKMNQQLPVIIVPVEEEGKK